MTEATLALYVSTAAMFLAVLAIGVGVVCLAKLAVFGVHIGRFLSDLESEKGTRQRVNEEFRMQVRHIVETQGRIESQVHTLMEQMNKRNEAWNHFMASLPKHHDERER